MQHILPNKIHGVNHLAWLENSLNELNQKRLSWKEYKRRCLFVHYELHDFLIDSPRREENQSWSEYRHILVLRLKQIIRDIKNPCFYIMESSRTGKVFTWPLLRTGTFSFMDRGSKKKMNPKNTAIFRGMAKTGKNQLRKGGFTYKIKNKGELF